jgi:hypothetical protein
MSISAQLEIVGKLHLEFMSGKAANSGSVMTYVLLREREIEMEKVLDMMMQASCTRGTESC